MRRLRLGIAQINTTVGDFKGNTRKILKAIADGGALGLDSSHFPSLPSAATHRKVYCSSPSSSRKIYGLCQTPPGVKKTSRAFCKERRLPITNRFKGC
jgi:hypothetical protein